MTAGGCSRVGVRGLAIYWENFKQYWKQHLCHVAIGFMAGYLTARDLPAIAFTIITWVAVRQSLEYFKRNDTPGIDMAWYMVGLLTGIVVGLADPYYPKKEGKA